mgnify:CR=1 FL=1
MIKKKVLTQEQIAEKQHHHGELQHNLLPLHSTMYLLKQRDARTAANLKRQGVKAGVPDLHLPVARGGYNGLYIELKVGSNNSL